MGEMTKKMQELSVTLDTAKKAIDAKQIQIPIDLGNEIAKVTAEFDKYKKGFVDTQAASRTDLSKKDEELQSKNLEVKRANERVERVTTANNDLIANQEATVDPFQFDKPQGKPSPARSGRSRRDASTGRSGPSS